MSRLIWSFVLAIALASLLAADFAVAQGENAAGKVEIIRDTWGIPHIFSETDEGAMYGLGYATAQDRAFQMYLSLRLMQGRLAETIGNVPKKNRKKGTSLDSDRMMRTFGFYRAAKVVAANLDEESKSFLQAYSDGVNDYISKNPDKLSYLFKKYTLRPEPWTPADCIVVWWHLAQFFGTDGTRDFIHYRNLTSGQAAGRGFRPGNIPVDDYASVIKREDVREDWIAEIENFLKENGYDLKEPAKPGEEEKKPKFSHAWVVGKSKTTTKSSVLCSDPQTIVGNPSMFYGFHVCGKTFNARGMGVAGSPVILIGWSENVAWGMTALGADQADLFRLKTDPEKRGKYFHDGKWKDYEIIKETILVKGGRPVEHVVRETCFGPVITRHAFMGPNEGEVAVKRIPVCETDAETIQGAVVMMRAGNAAEFAKALAGWRFPSANVVFGDREGNIGYSAVGALPLRSPLSLDSGRAAHDGSDSKYDWKCIIPHKLVPQVINPKRGFLLSANHRPIESFYPDLMGISTGSMGDTVRSWRLRERLQAKEMFKPEDVLDVHLDTVNPARRDIVRFGLHLRDVHKAEFSRAAVAALRYLEPWYKSGASMDLKVKGAEVASHITTFFRFASTELARKHGGGQSGLCRWLRDLGQRIDKDPKAKFEEAEVKYIENALAGAWTAALQRYGRDMEKWGENAIAQVKARRMGFFESLDGFPSLDPEQDFACPPLTCVDGNTIKSQAAQAYSQWVPMHDVDSAKSILLIGQSEIKDSKLRWKTYDMWAASEMHPAPLTRKGVEKFKAGVQVLTRGKSAQDK